MMISIVLKSAMQSLRTNVLRTALTMLGIIIGISSVILISSIGKGAVKYVTDELSSFGTNLFQIVPGQDLFSTIAGGGQEPITMDDVEEIKDANISNIETVVAFEMASRQVYANDESETALIYGMTYEAEPMLKPNLIYGEFLSEYDEGSRVAVLGNDIAEELYGENTDPVGETIKIEDIKFEVIGVTKSAGGFTGSFFDTAVSIPLDVMIDDVVGDDSLTEIDISVYNTEVINETMDEVEYILRDYRDIDEGEDNDFTIQSFEESLDTITTITDLLTLMIAGISAISLLVGGVGVMNIMFVSVTERTKEIGLLKSIGAKEKDILSQFLLESVVMTTIGGLVGIAIGIAGAFLVSTVAGIPFIVSPAWVIFAVGISSLVGILFGVYPARRASKLSPIDALRHE